MSRNHLNVALAATLIVGGLACMIYALVQLQSINREVAGAYSHPEAAKLAVPDDMDAGELQPETGPDVEEAASDVEETASDVEETDKPFATPKLPVTTTAKPPAADQSPTAGKDHKEFVQTMASHGLVLTLALIVVVVIVALLLRRLRPTPLRHGPPTDTTDLWREAGRRLK
ncbi:MAG: hypothetical protein JXL80_15345 [Planctomycetes bacterium]|nr:hypothetical protein [Planctomycetota bacterium]